MWQVGGGPKKKCGRHIWNPRECSNHDAPGLDVEITGGICSIFIFYSSKFPFIIGGHLLDLPKVVLELLKLVIGLRVKKWSFPDTIDKICNNYLTTIFPKIVILGGLSLSIIIIKHAHHLYLYSFLAVGVLERPGSAPVLLGKGLRVDVLVQALVRGVKMNVLLKLHVLLH